MIANIFDIDYNKLIRWLVPVHLRKPVLMALLQVLISPVVLLYQNHRRYRRDNLYRLGITGQVCYLEKMLNDKYDRSDRRIRIEDAIDRPPVFLYQAAEGKPVYLGSRPLYRENEFGINLDDFVVYVPGTVIFEFNEMRSLIDLYKLAGTRYSIQFF